jgi:hypothetical protein
MRFSVTVNRLRNILVKCLVAVDEVTGIRVILGCWVVGRSTGGIDQAAHWDTPEEREAWERIRELADEMFQDWNATQTAFDEWIATGEVRFDQGPDFYNRLAGGHYVGTTLGTNALDYYADIIADPNASYWKKGPAYVGGFFAALWTPETYLQTTVTLAGAYGASSVLSGRGLVPRYKSFFGRGGLFNSNRFLRVGVGRWGGEEWIRVSGKVVEKVTFGRKAHWNWWKRGPWGK